MAYNNEGNEAPGLDATVAPAADVTLRRAVGWDDAQIAAVGAAVQGVAYHNIDVSEVAEGRAILEGIVLVEAGAAVAKGDPIVPDASGRGIPGSAANCFGIAMGSASAAGRVFPVLLTPGKPAGASVNLTAATLTLAPETHGGRVVTVNKADGSTITLPASSGSGVEFEIFVGTTMTSNLVIQVANATDIMQGGVGVATDAAGVSIPTAATSDTITMNGSTTGGVKGSFVRLRDVSSGIWRVEGFLVSTGAEATPFSAAVS